MQYYQYAGHVGIRVSKIIIITVIKTMVIETYDKERERERERERETSSFPFPSARSPRTSAQRLRERLPRLSSSSNRLTGVSAATAVITHVNDVLHVIFSQQGGARATHNVDFKNVFRSAAHSPPPCTRGIIFRLRIFYDVLFNVITARDG
jgi:hypothetical protein